MSLLLLFSQPAPTPPGDVTGAGAITFGAMTGAAAGTVLVSGASASTFGTMTGEGAGKVYIVGAGAITFGAMTGSASDGAILPTPASRIYTVAGETRQNTIAADNRAYIVAAESRVVEVQ